MKKMGLVVAVEVQSVLNKYGTPVKEEKIDAYNVLTYNLNNNTLYVISCGVGEIAAAAATQFCISKLNCKMIITFGIVGGLTKEMSETKTCIVERIVHYDFDTSADTKYKPAQYSAYPDIYIPSTPELVDKALAIKSDLKKVTIASGDKFVGTASKKKKLHKTFNADICDMEAAGIALTCNRNNIPFLMIKCVSDGFKSGIATFEEYFDKSASTCFEITDKILQQLK